MKSSFGKNLKISIYGGSHEDCIGVIIDGLPKDIEIDKDKLMDFLKRRAPGNSPYTTPRKEADIPIFIGDDPLEVIIKNTNRKSKDYSNLLKVPRPGHADFTAYMKYKGKINMAGGGPFSARMTAPLCIAGGIALQFLEKKGIKISAKLESVGGKSGDEMYDEIMKAKEEGDSIGGVVSAQATGLPIGLGGPMYDGIESVLAPIIFGIPAVKGLTFGNGFEGSELRGSINNDPFCVENGQVKTRTNNSGGILGGITNGMPLTLKVAFKPTPSIEIEQDSVNLETMKEEKLIVRGRHDPCVAVRGVPVLEAAIAVGIMDVMLEEENELR